VLVVLATLAFDFIANAARAVDTATILANALTAIENGSRPSAGVLLLFGFTWLVGATLTVLEGRAGRAEVHALAVIPTVAGLAALGTVVVMLILAGQHAALANTRFATVDDLVASGDVVAGLLTGFYAMLLTIGALWALALGGETSAPRTAPGWAWLMAAGATVLALVGAIALNLRVIQADIIYKTAQQIETDGYPDVAARLYERVIAMAPSQDFYYLFLGRAYLSSTALVDETRRSALLETAQAQLLDAQQINPYNTDHTANLARLHREWARTGTDGAERAEHARIANDYYDRATRLSPNNAGLWNEWGLLSYQLLGDAAATQAQLDRSLTIDPTFDQTYLYLGDFRSWQGGLTTDAASKDAAYEQAIAAYESGLERNQGQGTTALQMRLGLAVALVDNQRIEEAIAQYEIVAQANLGANQWQLLRALAALHAQKGDGARALEYAQQALAGAPDANKAEVQQFINDLIAPAP